MVSSGGAFAEAIFLAYNIAVRTAVAAAAEPKAEQDVKVQSPEEERKEKRARDEGNDGEKEDTNAEGDQHVDKRARCESAVPGAGNTEDRPAEAAVSAGG